jgi:hypothetical protein
LASQIVHVSTDAKAKPSITALTMMSADINMPNGVRSRGKPAEASSVDDSNAPAPALTGFEAFVAVSDGEAPAGADGAAEDGIAGEEALCGTC